MCRFNNKYMNLIGGGQEERGGCEDERETGGARPEKDDPD